MLEQLLKKHFQYESFRPGQKEVIEAVIEGRDVLALLPTGSGKSLCYQLPAYILNGTVLIVSPLLSLMQDQVEQLKLFGEKRVVAINSFLVGQERSDVYANLASYRFIFVSPEMLNTAAFQQALSHVSLCLIAIDEAHCISQWGFDFRPEYLKIGELINAAQRPPILALTATATKKVVQDIESYLLMKEPYRWIASVDRPNIALQVVEIDNYQKKIDWIMQHIRTTIGPGIVYMQSRKKTAEYAQRLRQQNIRVAAYHAGMDPHDRQLIQQQFIAGELDWIIATNAFGMGVHKANIRQIIHDHLPSTVGAYMQEIGRAGRDGEQSFATLLYSPDDERLTKSITVMDYPTAFQINHYYHLLAQRIAPETMLEDALITETSFRILTYWVEKLQQEQILLKMNELAQEKMKEVDYLRHILLGNDCIREEISRYFGQELITRPTFCCSVCAEINEHIPVFEQQRDRENDEFSWEYRLNQIFSLKK